MRLRFLAAEVIALLEPASKRQPHSAELLFRLAEASAAVGAKEQARAYYLRIIAVTDNPKVRRWAQEQADSGRWNLPPSEQQH